MKFNSNWNTGHTNHFELEMGRSIRFIIYYCVLECTEYEARYYILNTCIVLFTFYFNYYLYLCRDNHENENKYILFSIRMM